MDFRLEWTRGRAGASDVLFGRPPPPFLETAFPPPSPECFCRRSLNEKSEGNALPDFIPGLDLARAFYFEIVRKIVAVPHAAALLGEGSEVLGFDQPRSTDHAWGPRLQIFVDAAQVDAVAQAVERRLPAEFKGWPVRFYSWETNTVRHHAAVTALEDWTRSQIGIDPLATELSAANWLALPQQRLLQITAGEAFHDDGGHLRRLRRMLSWYPRDVWLWAMASQWHLIGNAEPRIGRTLEAGDKRGSALMAARIARLLMELSFLQERRYWPYDKWFGTAFSRLAIAPALGPYLDAILAAHDEHDRMEALHAAMLLLAYRHNKLGVTSRVEPKIGPFQVGVNNAIRPYNVINAGDFAESSRAAIRDGALRKLATVGTFDQLTHADDALVNFTAWPQRIAKIYEDLLSGLSIESSG
jgi:hypothetical protein